ncbi:hypothetical protein SLEP1_g47944 [Rubroshorea leprosula]|uniref:DUF4220 domain-containing protein n=1 Tax=Rubroshorea leprosula TaxID=152421 RepID=A0AAV5LT05_9ROSI|nr:hypothetical protein SLEP1_g47944 [Rubroshorea leprosula]
MVQQNKLMKMVFCSAENIKNLWDTWNIEGLIILSLLVQSFLILFALLRKQKGGKWIVMIPIWLAYLLADWVATFTIGLILRAEPSDILVFWAPFLLLHLGGPDIITSFSMEDTEFWIRHLLGLVLQIGSTIYVILQSLPQNKLLLPTFLVLIAGTIKYAERNRAFYVACFDHFGDNWRTHHWPMIGKHSPFGYLFYGRFPNQFLNTKFFCRDGIFAVFGIFKSLLVGPRMPSEQKGFVLSTINRSNSGEVLSCSHSSEVLQNIEISLSLLYELLHTKLPVVDSKIAYFHRIANFGCILGALLLFSMLKKHYKLGEFDTWLTYGLLTGALALDLISVISLVMFSDWICFGHDENVESQKHNKRRIRSAIKRIRCVSSKDFKADQEWHFIFRELLEPVLNPIADNERGKRKEIDAKRYGGILQDSGNLNWSIKKFEYIESLLMWHIATEICYLSGHPSNHCASSTSTSGSLNHREICKEYIPALRRNGSGQMKRDSQKHPL